MRRTADGQQTARRAQRRPASRGRRAAAGSAAAPWAHQLAAPLLPQGGTSLLRSARPRGPDGGCTADSGGDDDGTTRARRRRAGRLWRPDLQLVEVNGARRGALPGGDARHMLLQDSLLGALAVQVIWGLCWAASRTLGTLDQR